MDRESEQLFSKIIKIIEKESDSDLALVAMIQYSEIAIHIIDPKEANKKIDEYSNGLFY